MPHETPDHSVKPSYMIHVEGKGLPTVVHDELQVAAKEAERLANKEQRRVAIYQVVAVATPPKPQPIEWSFADNVSVGCSRSCDHELEEENIDDLLRGSIESLFESLKRGNG